MVKNITPDITTNIAVIKRNITMKPGITVNITKVKKVTKVGNSVRRKDIKKVTKRKGIIINSIRTNIIRSINSTMIIIRADTIANMVISMDIMKRKEDIIKREIIINPGIMKIIMERKDITIRDIMKMIIKDIRDIMVMKNIMLIMKIMGRKEVTKVEKVTGSAAVTIKTENITHEICWLCFIFLLLYSKWEVQPIKQQTTFHANYFFSSLFFF